MPILAKLNIGEIIGSKTIYDKYNSELDFKSKAVAKRTITVALKIAYESKSIQRINPNDQTAPEWFKQLDTVSFWQAQLRGSRFKNIKSPIYNGTKMQYLYQLWKFNKWLSGRGFTIHMLQSGSENSFIHKTEEKKFDNVEDLIRLLEQPFMDQKNVTKIIKQYLLDEIHAAKKASYMTIIKSAIASYFEKNECQLHITFNPKNNHSTETAEKSMSLSDLMEFLTTGRPSITEKTVFLCKFHRGLDVSTFVDRFNYEAWEQITKWFGSEHYDSWDLEKCPVPISLVRIKTDFKHTGYLERDSIEQLQRYMDYRKTKVQADMQNGQPLFLNKFNRPISTLWMFVRFSKISKRSGIQKFTEFNGRKQYKMDSHELRDLLKSTLIDSGCRIDVADHVIGHKPKDSYEKQSILYPETMRKEYAKASKRLNIFTKFSNIVSGNDDSDDLRIGLNEKIKETDELRRSLNEKIKETDELMKDTRASRAEEYQNEFFGRDLLNTVNDLKRQVASLKDGRPQQIEFCCADCNTIHRTQACPACGSQMKRMYEQGFDELHKRVG